jgi:hypothetical protein
LIKTFNDYVCDIIKIKSFLGTDEVAEKATLEKILIMPFLPHKPNLMFPKKFFSQEVFWAPFFQKRCENKNLK